MDFFLNDSHCRKRWAPFSNGHCLELLLSLITASKFLLRPFGSLFLKSPWDLPGSHFDVSILLSSRSCTIAGSFSQVFNSIKLGGFDRFWGLSIFPNHSLSCQGATSQWPLPNYLMRISHQKSWRTPANFARLSSTSTKLFKSWSFIVGYDCILDSCGDKYRWGYPNFLPKVLQATLNIDREEPTPWTDFLAAPVNKLFRGLFFSLVDSELLPTVEWNIPLHSGQSKVSPAKSLNYNLGKDRPLKALDVSFSLAIVATVRLWYCSNCVFIGLDSVSIFSCCCLRQLLDDYCLFDYF